MSRSEVERLYEIDLRIYGMDHINVRFDNFLMNEIDGTICPLGGNIMYLDGKVNCSLHGDRVKGSDDEGVPFL